MTPLEERIAAELRIAGDRVEISASAGEVRDARCRRRTRRRDVVVTTALVALIATTVGAGQLLHTSSTPTPPATATATTSPTTDAPVALGDEAAQTQLRACIRDHNSNVSTGVGESTTRVETWAVQLAVKLPPAEAPVYGQMVDGRLVPFSTPHSRPDPPLALVIGRSASENKVAVCVTRQFAGFVAPTVTVMDAVDQPPARTVQRLFGNGYGTPSVAVFLGMYGAGVAQVDVLDIHKAPRPTLLRNGFYVGWILDPADAFGVTVEAKDSQGNVID